MTRAHSRGAQRFAVVLAVAVVLLLVDSHSAAAQCAMCRRALQSPEGQRMIAAFRSGIIVLLAAPFTVFGTVAVLAVRRFRAQPPPPAEKFE